MILIIQAAATWFMTGLIWFVQIVHYPLFAAVGREGFAQYEIAHSRLTTFVVAPVMLIELLGGIALLFDGTAPKWSAVAGAVLLGTIWISTALIQVPAHGLLSAGFDEEVQRRLVTTNWIRTAAWSLRAALMVWLVSRRAGY